MKKILSITAALLGCILAIGTMTSCSKSDDYNTGEATVELDVTSYEYKESKGIFRVPIVVKGEQNGPIFVKIETESTGNGAVEDVHYYITGKSFNIPSGKKTVYVEIKAVDDHVINSDRQFRIKIAEAQGAKISESKSSCLISLLDNDDIPYERLEGTWKVTALEQLWDNNNAMSWQEISWETEITTYDEDSYLYGKQLTMTGWRGYEQTADFIKLPLSFSYNETTKETSIGIALGIVVADSLDFSGTGDETNPQSSCTVRSASYVDGITLLERGTFKGKINATADTITFTRDAFLTSTIHDANNNYLGTWFTQDSIVMVMQK